LQWGMRTDAKGSVQLLGKICGFHGESYSKGVLVLLFVFQHTSVHYAVFRITPTLRPSCGGIYLPHDRSRSSENA
jgi:hypothetical protein